MRLRLIGFILLAYFALVGVSQAAIPTPIIKIDAATLTPGPITTSINNAGSQGGTFDAKYLVKPPVVETVAGKQAITFCGANALKASFTAPDTVTGGNAWSVSTWVYNPTVSSDNDFYFSWARRASSGGPSATTNEVDGRTASLLYSTANPYAAADHYGKYAMTWGRLKTPPTAGQWHNITITYDGADKVATGSPIGTGTELLYVDGVLVTATVGKALNLFTGSNVLIGAEERAFNAINSVQTPNQQNYCGLTGSIASLQMFTSVLSPDDVATLAGGATLQTGTVTDLIMNNSFEDYTYGGRDRDSQDLGNGYWFGYTYQGKDWYGTKNQYIRQTKFPSSGGDHWNNGDNFDGYHVLAMEATYPTKTYVSQALFGIEPNSDYKVWGYFNARCVNAKKQMLELKMDGVDILSPAQMEINASDGTAQARVNPFTKVTASWHSNASASHYLTIGSAGIQGNDYNGIACDKICIAKVGGPSKPVCSVKDLPKLTQLDFFGVQAGSSLTKSFTLFNDGGTDMSIVDLPVIGSNGYAYSASASAMTVPAFGGMVTVSVTFSPTASGNFNDAQLKIITDSTATPNLLLPLTGFSTPLVANGSFETIYINTGGGDYQGSYPGWITNATPGNIGFSYNNTWKWDNGKIVDGRQAATLNRNTKDDTTTTLGQSIPGFVKGHTYKFRFYANSWKGTTSNAYDGQVWSDFKVNGVSAKGVQMTGSATATKDFPTAISNRENAGTFNNNYNKFEYTWTSPVDGAVPIEFGCVGNTAGDGQNSLLLDNVGVFDTAVAGPVTVSTTKLDFGNRTFNTTATMSMTVYNAGGKDVKITTATLISGGQASAFGITTTLPQTIAYGGSVGITVKYLNTSFGQKDSTLTLVCDTGDTFNIALTANTTYAAYYPTVTNGTFDDTGLSKPGDVNNNDNANGKWSVPGSSKTGRSGSGSMYNNNGIDPEGGTAMWIRKTAGETTWTISQDLASMRAGHTYRLTMFANASASLTNPALPVSGQAHLVVSFGTNTNTNLVNVIDTTVTAVNTAGVFTTNWPTFTADYTAPSWVTPGTSVRLAIKAGISGTDNALLFDGVKVQEVSGGLQVSPTSVRFNTVNWYKNDKPSTATVTVTNTGIAALNLTGGATGYPGLTIVDTQFYNASKQLDPQYSFVSISPTNKTSLAPGESVSAVVKFNPTKKGNYTASALLRVTSNDPNFGTFDVPLIGDAVPVELSTFSAE